MGNVLWGKRTEGPAAIQRAASCCCSRAASSAAATTSTAQTQTEDSDSAATTNTDAIFVGTPAVGAASQSCAPMDVKQTALSSQSIEDCLDSQTERLAQLLSDACQDIKIAVATVRT